MRSATARPSVPAVGPSDLSNWYVTVGYPRDLGDRGTYRSVRLILSRHAE